MRLCSEFQKTLKIVNTKEKSDCEDMKGKEELCEGIQMKYFPFLHFGSMVKMGGGGCRD